MLKEIHGKCTEENVEIIKELENRFPVAVDVRPGGSQSQTLFTITETEEGAVGAALYKDMKTLMDYSDLFKQLELEQKVSPEALASSTSAAEKIATVPTEKVPYYLALWSRVAAQMRLAFEA